MYSSGKGSETEKGQDMSDFAKCDCGSADLVLVGEGLNNETDVRWEEYECQDCGAIYFTEYAGC
jgi:hypothetical protein